MDRFQNTRQPDWDWWGKLWPTPGETLRRLGIETGTTLAEVGSGNGYFALPAARIVSPATVYAVDLDPELLAELDRLADQQAIENVTTVRADARDLSEHLPEPADDVLIANTLHGADDPAALVREADDATASDGRLLVVNWRDEPRESTTVAGEPRGPPTDLRLSPGETAALVEDATDWTQSRRVALPPHHYGLTFA